MFWKWLHNEHPVIYEITQWILLLLVCMTLINEVIR